MSNNNPKLKPADKIRFQRIEARLNYLVALVAERQESNNVLKTGYYQNRAYFNLK
jgi:hypothetical protein